MGALCQTSQALSLAIVVHERRATELDRAWAEVERLQRERELQAMGRMDCESDWMRTMDSLLDHTFRLQARVAAAEARAAVAEARAAALNTVGEQVFVSAFEAFSVIRASLSGLIDYPVAGEPMRWVSNLLRGLADNCNRIDGAVREPRGDNGAQAR